MKSVNKNLVLECAVFATAVVVLNLYVFHDTMLEWNPNPLWAIVVILAMRHGSPAGLVAGCVAAGLHLWELTRVGYGFEHLIHRTPQMLVGPVLYIFVGMYLGETRERLARRSDHFKDLVDELNGRLDANEIRRLNLERAHLDMEKRIAGNADTLLGVYNNLNRLDAAETEDELWRTLAEIVAGGVRAEASGVWRMEPMSLLAVVGAMPDQAPPLALMAARRRGVATIADWVSEKHQGAPMADMAGVVTDDANDPVVLAVSGMDFGQLNRNSAIYFELIVQRVRIVVRELRRLEGLKRISISDPQLGLGSESYLKARIHEQALLARRHQDPFCLACCAFEAKPPKNLAEELDIVLACAIRSAIRASDGIAYFTSRNAFVVMLPQCDLTGARVVMKNVAANLDTVGLADADGLPLLAVKWNCEQLGADLDGEAMYDRLFAGMGGDADAVSVAEVRVNPGGCS